MERLLILDSNSIINRAFYGIRTLNAPDGTPTNAVYGFLNILIKLINDYKPQYILAAFDLKAPTFRHKMYEGYKATRHGMPEELAAQMPVMKSILSDMNIPILQLEGYEADDIIGTVSRVCGEKNMECYIATGDRDDLQLADNGTTVVLASTQKGNSVTDLYDENAVKEKYGVLPHEFVDMKALMGDTSDNIPGVKGIGEKTASKLITQFSTIENMYEHIDEANVSAKIKEKLLADKDNAFLSKKLAQIDMFVPIDIDFDSGRYTESAPDFKPELYTNLMRLGLKSVVKKLNLSPPAEITTPADEDFFNGKETIDCPDYDSFIKGFDSYKDAAALYASVSDNVINSVAVSDGKKAYILRDMSMYTKAIEYIFSCSKDIYVCNAKEILVAAGDALCSRGYSFDCAIAAYLDNPSNAIDIDAIATRYLGVYLDDSHENAQLSLFEDEAADDRAGRYAHIIFALYGRLSEIIEKNNQHELFYDVEMPLIEVLASMEILGITLDTSALKQFGDILSLRISELEDEIYDMAGESFNINSPKQLGVILFEKLGLPHGKKTKSGWSTKADILEKLAENHPIVASVLEYRTYQKLKTTYCDSLVSLVNPATGRIHSKFHQTGTVTGRLSSSDPNMQNIPTRTKLGREIRRMFAAKDGCVLVDADYSQIELRILAHLSQDENMINAFRSGMDIHAVTASQVLGIPIDKLTKEERASAKAINFGIVYGMGEYSLAQDLGISFKQAKDYMDGYFAKYSGVRQFMDNVKKEAHENGYVKTMMNRIRYIPELNSSNANLRSFGERAAMNTPVQGTAADIMKLAMVKVYNRLKTENVKARMILQVHDELIIETPLDEVDKVKALLTEEMENTVALSVPLIAEAESGKSWYDAK